MTRLFAMACRPLAQYLALSSFPSLSARVSASYSVHEPRGPSLCLSWAVQPGSYLQTFLFLHHGCSPSSLLTELKLLCHGWGHSQIPFATYIKVVPLLCTLSFRFCHSQKTEETQNC